MTIIRNLWNTDVVETHNKLSESSNFTEILGYTGNILYNDFQKNYSFLLNSTNAYRSYYNRFGNESLNLNVLVKELESTMPDFDFIEYVDDVTLKGLESVTNFVQAILDDRIKVPGCDEENVQKFYDICDYVVLQFSDCASQVVNFDKIYDEISKAYNIWRCQYNSLLACVRNVNVFSTQNIKRKAKICLKNVREIF